MCVYSSVIVMIFVRISLFENENEEEKLDRITKIIFSHWWIDIQNILLAHKIPIELTVTSYGIHNGFVFSFNENDLSFSVLPKILLTFSIGIFIFYESTCNRFTRVQANDFEMA